MAFRSVLLWCVPALLAVGCANAEEELDTRNLRAEERARVAEKQNRVKTDL